MVRYPLCIEIGDQSITTVNGRMSFCCRVFFAFFICPECCIRSFTCRKMSDDEEALSFGPGLSELVAEVESQMAAVNPQLGEKVVGWIFLR